MLMVMNNAPQAPPPVGQDPYHFIMNPPEAPKKGKLPLPQTSSKRGRFIVVAVIALLAMIVVSIVLSVFSNLSQEGTNDLIELAQRQQEIIRIADIGITKAKSQETQSLAVTTKLAMGSDQQQILNRLAKNKVKLKAAELNLRKSTQTDALLVQADQKNQFDEAFTKTVQSQLINYQQAIKKTYDANNSKSARTMLTTMNDNANKLLTPKPAETSTPPAK
jgi:hypothetical protein